MKAQFDKIILVTAAALALSACGAKGNKTNVELIQDMMESPAIKAQEYDESSPNHSGMRVPADKTAPVGFTPYQFKGNLEGASKNPNPLAGKMDDDVLMIGQKYFETQCMVCHGQKGAGNPDSNVVKNMALKPPSVVTDKVKGWTDGHLYHVITEGQGVMGPYASHVPQAYRWQVVNYIRFLQKESK
ncbi:c-type cytochrome [Bdellovibrio sp. HCB337]|uniref:c-type cytochrome n=1 Tax=Bdellovibrio sp. HCB337 TaxID=3394358 RepID=UPI0039A61F75